MRVRISFDALRLCLLVAAGVTSGYLWRAAFESTSPAEDRVVAAPRTVQPAPAPPVVRIAPHHLTTPHRKIARTRRATEQVVAQRTRRAPATVASTPQPRSNPRSPTTPRPSPSPTPRPTPQPPPATTPAQQPVAAPVQQVSPPPPPPPPTTTPPVTSPPAHQPPPQTQPDDDDSRPGWGKGDKNHDHSGPGGKKP
jgi:hypothetical protein